MKRSLQIFVVLASLGFASASFATTCAIRTVNGHFLTAVGGGGRTSDVVHSDAVRIGDWERFTLVSSGDGPAYIHYGLRTMNGHFVTAVSGGNRTADTVHTDATQIGDWEKFTLLPLGRGWVAIQTVDGHFLTAVGGGGVASGDVLHTDAMKIGDWEKFRLLCTHD